MWRQAPGSCERQHSFPAPFNFFFSSSSSSVCPSICAWQGYQISYRLDSRDPQRWTTVEVGSNARQFTVTGLLPEQTYVFKLVSRTAVGWGEEKEALVVTTERRGKRTAANVSRRRRVSVERRRASSAQKWTLMK